MTQGPKKTTQIITYLIDLIRSGKVPVNKIMPSEHQLMTKFSCSRNIVVSVYQKLASLGAVYSIQKRGHFVSENFHNFVKPLSTLLKVEKIDGEEVLQNEWGGASQLPQWAVEKHIIFVEGFRHFKKRYYIKDELMGEGDVYVSLKNLDPFEPVHPEKPLFDLLSERGDLHNVVYELVFEDVEKFGQNPALVIRFFGYDSDSICVAGQFYIHPKYFKFNHHEFSIN
ncbi:GntR family transcriptional regulator [Mycoplasma corogypsi]|uniref:GntR family transcriptional regulator n=1 Tax=Mycoplasma corogypsi TaxID=2106 RepID=UPI003872F31F